MVINWKKIQTLREHYLALGQDGSGDYWADQELVESYDAVLGARIAWKWTAVLERLQRDLEFRENVSVLDWGCGTAVASREFFKYFASNIAQIYLYDRSQLVARFGQQKLLDQNAPVTIVPSMPNEKATIALLSHVINEFNDASLVSLIDQLIGHELIIWLEPGTHQESRNLGKVRSLLLDHYEVVAPCPKQSECPMFAFENRAHWCHFFAKPPTEAFQSPVWTEASKNLGIDLRSLPTSFLCLKLKNSLKVSVRKKHIDGVLIGRPRIYKGYLKYLECHENGLRENRLQKRDDKIMFKKLSGDVFLEFFGGEYSAN